MEHQLNISQPTNQNFNPTDANPQHLSPSSHSSTLQIASIPECIDPLFKSELDPALMKSTDIKALVASIRSLDLDVFTSVSKLLSKRLPKGCRISTTDMSCLVTMVNTLNEHVQSWNELTSKTRVDEKEDSINTSLYSITENAACQQSYNNIISVVIQIKTMMEHLCSILFVPSCYAATDTEAIRKYGVREKYRHIALHLFNDPFSNLVEQYIQDYERFHKSNQRRRQRTTLNKRDGLGDGNRWNLYDDISTKPSLLSKRKCSFENSQETEDFDCVDVDIQSQHMDTEEDQEMQSPTVSMFCEWVVNMYTCAHSNQQHASNSTLPSSTQTHRIQSDPVSAYTLNLLEEFVYFVGGFSHTNHKLLYSTVTDWVDRHFRQHTQASGLVRWQMETGQSYFDRLIVEEFGGRRGLALWLKSMSTTQIQSQFECGKQGFVGCFRDGIEWLDQHLDLKSNDSDKTVSGLSTTPLYRHREMGIIALSLPSQPGDPLIQCARCVGRAIVSDYFIHVLPSQHHKLVMR
ncbi:hypothetical protein BDV3_002263 [Batrachochytrium dendrobatidis]